ncbi:MAG: T9SS type A sorting domain-containing protein [Balneolales bacterium]|nr:T9SS type A sorting domain-containing protein [Balneolales bacterium]
MFYPRMRLLSLFTLLVITLLPATWLNAQVVTTIPDFPTEDQPVSIIFDATQGNGGLAGYTGDVYAHTGVITNLSSGPSGWRYVKTNWGQNTPETKLTRIGEDLYQLDIEDIRAYYGVPASEQILQLAFVFRSEAPVNGSWREGKDVGNADIFVDLFVEPLLVRFTSPSDDPFSPTFAEPGDDVEIRIAGFALETEIAALRLFAGDELLASVNAAAELTYTLSINTTGRIDLRAEVEDNTGETAEAFTYIVVNPEVTEAAPPSGTRYGINYHNDDTSATLAIWAPYIEHIYVIGDFTEWEIRPEYFMNRHTVNPDSVMFWTTVTGLTPGVEYGFQYLVEGERRIGELYSHKMLDPWNDRFISEDVYPNLKAYPTGKTSGVVSILQTAAPQYEWQTTDYQRIDHRDMIKYELLIRDWMDESTYANLADSLDYLQRLGINALELMPVSNFDGNISWGYNPNFHLAVEKSYGPAFELKRLIDEAHSRGMAVLLDVVYNHATDLSPLIGLYGHQNNPLIGPGHEFNVFNHLNHDHPKIKYWMDRANRFWIEEFRVDGFRFDLTKGFATNFNSQNYHGYNAQRIANLKRMADAIWEVDPDFWIVLEHFTANSEEMELSNWRRNEGRPGMLLWGNMNFNYNEATMGWHSNNQSNFSGVFHQSRGWNAPNLVGYMESHDEQRLMYRNLQFGNSSAGYSVRDFETAIGRQKLAGAFFFTIPGPKMIWQFGELGYDIPLDETGPNRTAPMPVMWDEYLADPVRVELYNTWRALIHLRQSSEAFRTENVDLDLQPSVKRIRLNHESMNVTIIGNFDVNQRTVDANVQHTGVWYDYFAQEERVFSATNEPVVLGPGEFVIYTSQFVALPEGGLMPVGIHDEDLLEQPAGFGLLQNYPNPFNPTTNIRYEVGQATDVRLEVFNVLGQRVALLHNGMQTAGTHTVQFDGSRLTSGVYLVRMQANGQTFTNKMLLVK